MKTRRTALAAVALSVALAACGGQALAKNVATTLSFGNDAAAEGEAAASGSSLDALLAGRMGASATDAGMAADAAAAGVADFSLADTDCTACHAVQAASMETAAESASTAKAPDTGSSKDADTAGEVASADAPAADAACLAAAHGAFECGVCHTNEKVLAAVHANPTHADPAKARLTRTKVSTDACLACHQSYEALSEQVPDAIVVDMNGTEVDPHAAPGLTASHVAEDMACVQCHTAHRPVDAVETATQYCYSCHHAQKFECGTCHS